MTSTLTTPKHHLRVAVHIPEQRTAPPDEVLVVVAVLPPRPVWATAVLPDDPTAAAVAFLALADGGPDGLTRAARFLAHHERGADGRCWRCQVHYDYDKCPACHIAALAEQAIQATQPVAPARRRRRGP